MLPYFEIFCDGSKEFTIRPYVNRNSIAEPVLINGSQLVRSYKNDRLNVFLQHLTRGCGGIAYLSQKMNSPYFYTLVGSYTWNGRIYKSLEHELGHLFSIEHASDNGSTRVSDRWYPKNMCGKSISHKIYNVSAVPDTSANCSLLNNEMSYKTGYSRCYSSSGQIINRSFHLDHGYVRTGEWGIPQSQLLGCWLEGNEHLLRP